MNSLLNTLGSVLSVLWLVLIWAAVYMLREVLLVAEKSEKRSLGSWALLAALTLLLLPMVAATYSLLVNGTVLPLEHYVFVFSSMLLGALLLYRPVMALINVTGGVRAPKVILA